MNKTPFDSMQLSPEILRAVEDMNYTEMTEIQAGAIPLLLQGKDIIGRSSTGTGKTAAFGIPAVEKITADAGRKPQVLVLCPTRELAMQISDEIKKYAKYKQNVRLATIYGGQSMEIQIRQLKIANIVIGTPGRIMDHMRRHTLKLDELKMVILDEADEMLNMGFLEDIRTILKEVPQEHQTALFSATMPPAIMKITKDFQKDPELVAVDKGQKTLTSISQYYYQVPQARKMDALNLLLQMNSPARSVVFCNTKKMVDELVEYLGEHNLKSIGLHGDMKQAQRTRVMQDFKTGRIHVLVATDVAARGIDVEDVEAVFNYDIPQEQEYYIHRIGRTGRAGKQGVSHTLACNKTQVRQIKELERYIHTEIVEKAIPTAEEILEKRQDRLLSKIIKVLEEENHEQWQPMVNRLIEQGYTPDKIASALMWLLVGKEKKLVQNIKAVLPVSTQRPASEKGDSRVRLSVNIGRDQRIAPNFIVGAIVDATGLPAKAIGKIDIFDDYTLVEMSSENAKIVMEKMADAKIKGCKVKFSIFSEKPVWGGFAAKPVRRSFAPQKPYGEHHSHREFQGSGYRSRERNRDY